MPISQRLLFHIGLEKTATSSLQACLHHHGKVLRHRDLLYPKRNAAYGWMNHKPLVGCYDIDDAGDRWLKIDPSRRRGTVASLIAEITATQAQTTIISAEHFSSRFREKQIRELREDFGQFECHIIVVIRDHISRLCSSYSNYVMNGGTLSLDRFAEDMTRLGALDLRYADLIAPWKRIFGRDKVDLIAYGPRVLACVLRRIAPGLEDEVNWKNFREKVSVDAPTAAAMHLINQAAARSQPKATVAEWARGQYRRRQIRSWLQRHAQAEETCEWSFREDLLHALHSIVLHDKAKLETQFGFAMEMSQPMPSYERTADGMGASVLARALHAQACKRWSVVGMISAVLAMVAVARELIVDLRKLFRERKPLAKVSTARLPRRR